MIRPYCRRNGKGYTAGMNIATTAWVDWQEATEISREKQDHGMPLICRIYLILHITLVAVIVLAIAAAAFSKD